MASPDDGLYYSSKKRSEVDLDDTFNIGCIKSALYDNKDSSFYILCNKFEGEYGIFLILFSQENPNNHQFLVKCKNRLEVGDANISILTNKEAGYRELVIGYKVIHVNIYCVEVLDINKKDKSTHGTIFKHQSFQLWESDSMGFILHRNKDYIMLNNEGLSIISLGTEEKRDILDDQNNSKMIHSLESISFLKLEP